MAPCCQFTLRQCHKWYRAGDLHRQCHKWHRAANLHWDSVTNGTVLGIYTETVSQMVPCCQFTLRHFHKWHHTADLAETLLQICSSSAGHYDAVYLSYVFFLICKCFAAVFIVFIAVLVFRVVISSDAVGRYQCNIHLLSWVWRWPENWHGCIETSAMNYQKSIMWLFTKMHRNSQIMTYTLIVYVLWIKQT